MTFRGAHGLGAELGHIAINPDGPPCPGNCPNRGCIEAYCSGQALERDATELASDKPGSRLAERLGPDGKVSGRELVEAAEAGDPDALPALRQLRPHARHRHRRLRERVRARPARHRRRPVARVAPVPRPRRPGGRLPRASRRCWQRVTIALAEGGADAGVIGAGVLAALELAARARY